MGKALGFLSGILFIVTLGTGEASALEAQDLPGGAPISRSLFLFLEEGHDDVEVVRRFLENGADANYRDPESGGTPLHGAARSRNVEAVRLLVARGADVNAADRGGRTPLHDGVSYKSLDVVKILVGSGANVNSKNREGETPLRSVVYWDGKQEAMELVTLFLGRGFDLPSVDPAFLNDAIARGHGEIALLFLEKGARFNDDSLRHAAWKGDQELFFLLLERGANPVQPSILESGCASGSVPIVRTLVERGVVPSAEALNACAFHGWREAAVYLQTVLKERTGQEIDIRERCRWQPDAGICMALFTRAYFDGGANACREFSYGGCGGVTPFGTLEACRRMCEE